MPGLAAIVAAGRIVSERDSAELEDKDALDQIAGRQDKWRAEINEAHRAIGRYFVTFSRLLAHLRGLMSQRLTIDSCDKVELAELALGGATAQHITDAFFAMCRFDAELSTTEKGVCDLLNKAVNEEIVWRNKFAHGDWWISPRFASSVVPELIRMTPKKHAGIPAELTHHPPREIDQRSDAILTLLADVVEFGALALGLRLYARHEGRLRMTRRREYRVEDVFAFTPGSSKHGQKAAFDRTGPKADELVRIKTDYVS